MQGDVGWLAFGRNVGDDDDFLPGNGGRKKIAEEAVDGKRATRADITTPCSIASTSHSIDSDQGPCSTNTGNRRTCSRTRQIRDQ